MLRFILCFVGCHGVSEFDHTEDNKDIKVCRDCLKKVK